MPQYQYWIKYWCRSRAINWIGKLTNKAETGADIIYYTSLPTIPNFDPIN